MEEVALLWPSYPASSNTEQLLKVPVVYSQEDSFFPREQTSELRDNSPPPNDKRYHRDTCGSGVCGFSPDAGGSSR